MDVLSDEELLNLYFVGDARAFQDFFERHSKRVAVYGRSKGLSYQDSQDFVQEVFMKLHRSIHLYEKGKPALPWFFTLVHRVLIDHARKRGSKMNICYASSDVLHKVPNNSESLTTESAATVNLDTLPTDQRKVIELRVLEELSFKDISTITGKTEATSRKIFERAVKALRKIAGREN